MKVHFVWDISMPGEPRIFATVCGLLPVRYHFMKANQTDDPLKTTCLRCRGTEIYNRFLHAAPKPSPDNAEGG